MEIRGNRWGVTRSMASVLSNIETISENLSLASKTPKFYVLTGTKKIERISLWSPTQIYRMKRNILSSILKRSIRFGWSRCGATRIEVKNNIIAYYPEADKVLKLFETKEALHRHIEGVNFFSRVNPKFLQAPQIISAAVNPVPFSVEPFLKSKKIPKPLKLTEQEIEDLARFHLSTSELVYREFTKNEKYVISQVLNRFGFSVEQERFFCDIVQGNNLLLKGPVHGDLSRGNMIEFSEKKTLIDWELFSPNGVVGYDLAQIWIQCDHDSRVRILNIYSASIAKVVKKDAIEYLFSCQLIVGFLLRLYDLHTNTSKYWALLGMTKNKTKSKLAEKEEKYSNVLNDLYNYLCRA